jgi:hypothetical protein
VKRDAIIAVARGEGKENDGRFLTLPLSLSYAAISLKDQFKEEKEHYCRDEVKTRER